jgi:hypothetical protein
MTFRYLKNKTSYHTLRIKHFFLSKRIKHVYKVGPRWLSSLKSVIIFLSNSLVVKILHFLSLIIQMSASQYFN